MNLDAPYLVADLLAGHLALSVGTLSSSRAVYVLKLYRAQARQNDGVMTWRLLDGNWKGLTSLNYTTISRMAGEFSAKTGIPFIYSLRQGDLFHAL